MALLILNAVHRAARQISLHLEKIGLPRGLSADEAHVVSYLSIYGPCSVGRVSQAYGFKPSTMTSMLKRLEDRGWVERTLDPLDHRSFLLELTRDGLLLADSVHDFFERFEKGVLTRTSEEEMEGFEAVLQALRESMDGTSGSMGRVG